MARVKLPPARRSARRPSGPAYYERVLPEQLGEAIEEFFRVLQMLFQQILELALARLERDGNNTRGSVRKLPGDCKRRYSKVLQRDKTEPHGSLTPRGKGHRSSEQDDSRRGGPLWARASETASIPGRLSSV